MCVCVCVGACRKLIEYLHVDYLISTDSKVVALVQRYLGEAIFLLMGGGCNYILDLNRQSWMMYVLDIYKL